jgi:hypothetical protein
MLLIEGIEFEMKALAGLYMSGVRTDTCTNTVPVYRYATVPSRRYQS